MHRVGGAWGWAILRSGAARENIKYKWQNDNISFCLFTKPKSRFATQILKYTWHRSQGSRRSSMADANGHLSSCSLPPLLAWILLAGEQAQLELAFNEVLIGHAAAPLAWRGHQRRQGDWRPQLGSELWTSAPPPRLSLEASQAHYAASFPPRRPRKIS